MIGDPLPAWADGLQDDRVLRILGAVWARLPAHDRALLAAGIREAGADAPILENAIAAVGEIDAGLRVRLDLARVAAVEDDAAMAWVLAHECAHVALRHALIAPIGGLRFLVGAASSEAEDIAVGAYLEDAADFLAAVGWGFGAEMRAFFAAYPRGRRARWLREVS